MVVLFHGDLTVLLPGDRREPFRETVRNRFAAFLQLNHMQAYVSYPYTDIAKSSIYWRQVKELSLLHEKPAFQKTGISSAMNNIIWNTGSASIRIPDF